MTDSNNLAKVQCLGVVSDTSLQARATPTLSMLPNVIGLTGGIATGKSQVASLLRERGAVVVDADVIARQIVEPGQPAWHDIVARFGRQILTAEQFIDRKKLGSIVFGNEEQRLALVAITHPRIAQASATQFAVHAAHGHRVVFYEAALLVENGAYRAMAALIVVTAPRTVQIARIMRRDHLSQAEAIARIDAQMAQTEKVAVATWVIDNSNDSQLAAQVSTVYDQVMARFDISDASG
jgi:dephospho-CoA kinase